jgi:ABC-type antimicrobial peptide transport system permease subunit
MLGIFAAFALVLAVSGIYGVTAYLTSQRRREVAIRMALGASRTEIVRTVVGGGMTRVVVGVGLGLAGAVGAGRLLSSLLFGVPPHDPTVLMSVGAVLVAAAVLATIGPAKRAARVDPMVSLRTD